MGFVDGSISNVLGLDMNPFAQGMLQAESIAHLFPAVVTSFLANPILGFADVTKHVMESVKLAVHSTAESFHSIGVAAENAGVSVEFISALGAGTKAAGLGVGGLSEVLKFLAKNAYDAAHGGKEQMAAFSQLGISASTVRSHLNDMQGLLFLVSDGLEKVHSHAGKVQSAMALLGRGGSESLSALGKGSDHLRDLIALFTDLGVAGSAHLADISSDFVEVQEIAAAAFQGIRIAVSQPILEYFANHAEQTVGRIVSVSQGIRSAIGGAFSFIADHSAQIGEVVSRVSGVFSSAGGVIGNAVKFASSHFQEFATVAGSVLGAIAGNVAFGVLATVFGTIASAAATVIPAVVSFGVAVSSLGIVGAASAAGVGVLGTALAVLGAPIAVLGGPIAALVIGVGALVAGFAAFKSAGSAAGVMGTIKAAASSLWAEMKVVWGWIQSTGIPLVQQGLVGAFEIAKPVIHGLGSVAQGLMPILGAGWELFKDIALMVGGTLVEAFNVAVPIIRQVAELLGGLLEFIGKVLSGITKVASMAGDAIGFNTGGGNNAARQAVDDFASAGGAGGGSSDSSGEGDGGGSNGKGGGNTVNNNKIEVHVAAPIDADDAAHAIANKIKPAIQRAQKNAVDAMNSHLNKAQIRAGL